LSPEEASLMGNSEFLLLFENAALVKKIWTWERENSRQVTSNNIFLKMFILSH
jgi:hypothetical protein